MRRACGRACPQQRAARFTVKKPPPPTVEPSPRRDHSGGMAASQCWSLLIGASRLEGARRTFSTRDERIIQEITTRHFPGGYTILSASGGWFDPVRRRFIREDSRQVLICGAPLGAVRRWACKLGAALGQKELLLVAHGRGLSLKIARKTKPPGGE